MKRQLEGKKNPDKIVVMEVLSKRYGWTPNQIRQLNYSDIEQYLQIIRMQRKLEQIEYKKMKK